MSDKRMTFCGGPLQGHSYVLWNGAWQWAGPGEYAVVVIDEEEIELVPESEVSWFGWSERFGRVTVRFLDGVNSSSSPHFVFRADGSEATGKNPPEAAGRWATARRVLPDS